MQQTAETLLPRWLSSLHKQGRSLSGQWPPCTQELLELAESHLSLRSATSGAALWSGSVFIPSSACHHLRAQTPSQGQMLNQDPMTRPVLDLPTPEAGNKEPGSSP